MDVKYETALVSIKKWLKKSHPNLKEVEIEEKSKELVEKYMSDNLVRDIEEKKRYENDFNIALDKEFLNLYMDHIDSIKNNT
jgi:hypothetical protein